MLTVGHSRVSVTALISCWLIYWTLWSDSLICATQMSCSYLLLLSGLEFVYDFICLHMWRLPTVLSVEWFHSDSDALGNGTNGQLTVDSVCTWPALTSVERADIKGCPHSLWTTHSEDQEDSGRSCRQTVSCKKLLFDIYSPSMNFTPDILTSSLYEVQCQTLFLSLGDIALSFLL